MQIIIKNFVNSSMGKASVIGFTVKNKRYVPIKGFLDEKDAKKFVIKLKLNFKKSKYIILKRTITIKSKHKNLKDYTKDAYIVFEKH